MTVPKSTVGYSPELEKLLDEVFLIATGVPPLKEHSDTPNRYSASEKARARFLRRKGSTIKEIAYILNRNTKTVRRYLNEGTYQ
jgi:DNA-binding NarL/FixJ family response regulator